MRWTKNFPPYEEARKSAIEKEIKNREEYKSMANELGLPSDPNRSYKGKGWNGWSAYLGKEKNSFPPYEEARKRVIEKGIKNREEYKSMAKELGLPVTPNCTYKGKGWNGWSAFWGGEKKTFPPYEEARKSVIEKGIKTKAKYLTKYKELGLPSAPDITYKGKGWVDWAPFLGKVVYPSYENAHKIVMEKGIKSKDDYHTLYKKLGLPSNPNTFYKGKGWNGWSAFWGKPNKISHKERGEKVLSKLVLNPILLGDKAPLQIIYMLATNMDKELAEEIELLLKTASFEERLDWVKEQLKTLKVAVPTTPKSKSKTLDSEIPVMESMLEEFEDSMDEISAMESMLDVFEDTFDDLSEEDSTNIQTILENYYHNVINKEMIAEYDE